MLTPRKRALTNTATSSAGRKAQDVVDSKEEFEAMVDAEDVAIEVARKAAAKKAEANTGVTLATEKAIYEQCFEQRIAESAANEVGKIDKTPGMRTQRRRAKPNSLKIMLAIRLRYGVDLATIRKIMKKGDQAGWGKKLVAGEKL